MSDNLNTIRHPDLPHYKESVMSNVFGRFLGFLKAQGLTKGKEYDTQVQQIFEVSTKVLWIDEVNPTHQITVVVKSLDMSVEFGYKTKEEVLYRNKLEGLRYQIGTETELELTEGSQKKLDEFFEDFKTYYAKLAYNYV